MRTLEALARRGAVRVIVAGAWLALLVALRPWTGDTGRMVAALAVGALGGALVLGFRRRSFPIAHSHAIETLAERTHDALAILHGQAIAYCNAQFADLVGVRTRDVVGNDFLQFVAPAQRDDVQAQYQRRDHRPGQLTRYETLLVHQDGRLIPVDLRFGEITYQRRRAHLVLIRDLTAHKQAEAALQASETRSAAILSALPDLMFRLSRHGKYLDVRAEGAEREQLLVSGTAVQELVGKNVQDVLPEAQAALFLTSIRRVLDSGSMQVIEYDLPSEAGVRTFEARLVVSGKDEIVTIVRDMTERKRAERERERLIGDLDAFAQTVAHDLKTPLTSILGYAEMLTDDFATLPRAEAHKFLWIINHESRKMDRIIHELLLFASVREQRHVPRRALNMAYIVTSALGRLGYLITERGAQVSTPDEGWPIAQGYAPWVEEVWVNYLSNALKYGGAPPVIAMGAAIQPDGMVRFWVRDNGPGIPPGDQQRIFEQFTRLDEVHASGYGMGLWIVRRIVEKLGGSAGVESIPGSGSSFYFTLPQV